MGVFYTVRRGDSLWGLAGRHLGDFTRWPDIYRYHNHYAQHCGSGLKGVAPIADPDRIYVGQVLKIPGRGESILSGDAPQHKTTRKTTAIPLELETVYIIEKGASTNRVPSGPDTRHSYKGPISYAPLVTRNFTMTAELSGRIAIENIDANRHRSNWELATSRNRGTLSATLRQSHDQAFRDLTGEMGMSLNFTDRKATIRPSITAHAGTGPYTLELNPIGPHHISNTSHLNAIRGEIVSNNRRFRFSADVSIKIDVFLHPSTKDRPKSLDMPRNIAESPMKQRSENPVRLDKNNTEKILLWAGMTVVGILIIIKTGGVGAIAAGSGAGALSAMTVNPNESLGNASGRVPVPHTIKPNGS